ncbi:ComEA family DNA-binding protein [Leptolyngbya sp. 7M]|uniref:ComEA family DNA-binding protein n=1 Tax=Leptolyngbya sp. 7M TaxID=2812896 RepID=UPI001B8ABC27|nr:helix-hairpin-helix domain-containing protein [Leptolyngbya sp. 7M]QYO66611.1 helix-hairpin-helix domain-containing protein [Leptolyngbya sp. 7M]
MRTLFPTIRLFVMCAVCAVFACSSEPGQFADIEALEKAESSRPLININAADADELMRLPNVGTAMAKRIIEHREQYGPFRRPEDLMQVRGISDERFRRIRHLIRTE